MRNFYQQSIINIESCCKLWLLSSYCAFHKDGNFKIQKPPSQLRFSLPSIIITITSNEPWNTETHKTDRNPPITDHKPWPFEPVKATFCFLRGPLRWLTGAKNANVSWFLNFRVRVFMKSAVIPIIKLWYTSFHLIGPKKNNVFFKGHWNDGTLLQI